MPAKGDTMSVVVSFFSEKARERERHSQEGEVGAGGRVCVWADAALGTPQVNEATTPRKGRGKEKLRDCGSRGRHGSPALFVAQDVGKQKAKEESNLMAALKRETPELGGCG